MRAMADTDIYGYDFDPFEDEGFEYDPDEDYPWQSDADQDLYWEAWQADTWEEYLGWR
jgi:hypothetical protein